MTNSCTVSYSLKCLASLLHYIPSCNSTPKNPRQPLNQGCTQTSKACLKSMAHSTSSEQFWNGIHASFSSAFCSPRDSNEHTQDLTVSFPGRSDKKMLIFTKKNSVQAGLFKQQASGSFHDNTANLDLSDQFKIFKF